jgi:hypothetical protein
LIICNFHGGAVTHFPNGVAVKKGINMAVEETQVKDPNEALLVAQIDSTLKNYIESQDLDYVAFAPPNTLQNFAKFDHYCGDLIAAFGDLAVLVLEVKFNLNGTLNDLNTDQQSGLTELFSRGVPVYYSYNLLAVEQFPLKAHDQLQVLAAVNPALQTEKKVVPNAITLKHVVDELLTQTATGISDLALTLSAFVSPAAPVVASGIQNLRTHTLLLAYDKTNHSVTRFFKEELMALAKRVTATEFVASSKNAKDLIVEIKKFSAVLAEEKTVAKRRRL